jgi:hypothetical protein
MTSRRAGYISTNDLTGGAEMTEDQTAEEERQDSEQEETSEEEDEEAQASAEDADADSDEEEDEEENPEDERGESGGEIGGVDIDEVDPDEPTQDDNVAAAQMRKLEKEGPPDALADWPTGKAMYLTFGGSEGGEGYEDGSPKQMGPSSLRHYKDGSVEVQGEMVDNPEDYKAEEDVFEEHEKMPMDKGAKSDDDDSDEEGSSEDGASAEGDDSASAESDGSGSEESEEAEKAEAS